jgi:hypothetical protein
MFLVAWQGMKWRSNGHDQKERCKIGRKAIKNTCPSLDSDILDRLSSAVSTNPFQNFWYHNLRPLSDLIPQMKGPLLVCRIIHSQVTIMNSEYAAPFWTSSLKSVHKNWASGNNRSHHVLSYSRRCLLMVIRPYCGSPPGILAVTFCVLARWLSKSIMRGSGKGIRKGEQASDRTLFGIWIPIIGSDKQWSVVLHNGGLSRGIKSPKSAPEFVPNSAWNGEYGSSSGPRLCWISTEKNTYKQFTVNFPESSFADVYKEPLYEYFGGRFREFDGYLLISVLLGANPKSSKQVRFIIWAIWYGVWGKLGECVPWPQSSQHRILSPRYRSARQRNPEMNPWCLAVFSR